MLIFLNFKIIKPQIVDENQGSKYFQNEDNGHNVHFKQT